MSETDPAVPAPEPASPGDATPAPQPSTAPATDWQPLPRAAAITAMYGGSFGGLVLGLAPALGGALPIALRGLDWPWWESLPLAAAIWLLCGMIGCYAAYRRWITSAWRLDDTGLRFRRGYLWRKEILVPRSRVQHLDIERGPIERHYGLATLIVHTAGTRHHALRIAGLPDAAAVALRDALVPVAALHDDVL